MADTIGRNITTLALIVLMTMFMAKCGGSGGGGGSGKDKARAERMEKMYSGTRVNEAMRQWNKAPKK